MCITITLEMLKKHKSIGVPKETTELLFDESCSVYHNSVPNWYEMHHKRKNDIVVYLDGMQIGATMRRIKDEYVPKDHRSAMRKTIRNLTN